MNNSKPWYFSRTIWASVVAMLAGIGSTFGFDIDAEAQAGLVDTIFKIIAVGGSLMAIYGRFTATQPIS